MKKVINNCNKHSDLIGYITLVILFVFLNVNIWNNLEASIESDMSSELVMSKLLADEGKLVTTNWFYSTELKVLHNQLVFVPLFYLTDNWHVVRMASIVILDVILFLGYFYFARKLKMKHIPWIALMILGATSRDYYKFVLLGSHYIPDLVISFVTVGLLISYFEENSKAKKIIKLLIYCSLAMVSSLSGMRFVAVLHLPLVVSSFIYLFFKEFPLLKEGKFNFKESSIKLLLFTIVGFIFAYCGAYINSHILPSLGYSYKLDGGIVYYQDFSFENLGTVLNGILSVFGYQSDNLYVFSKKQLILKPLFASIFALTIWATIEILKNRKKYNQFEIFTTIFFVIGLAIMIVLYTFTTTWFRNRYLLSISVFNVFVIGIFLSHYQIKWQKWLYILVIALFTFGNTYFQIHYHIENDSYIELATVRDILLENDCFEGYCDDHWNGHNILTELSDGKIKTWCFGGDDLDTISKWLTEKSLFFTRPEGKMFVLSLKSNESKLDYNCDVSNYIYYEDNKRILYIFDSYEQLKSFIE